MAAIPHVSVGARARAALLNLLIDAVNGITPASALQAARSGGFPILSNTVSPIVSWGDGVQYNVGDLTLGAGTWTCNTAGLYLWGISNRWNADTVTAGNEYIRGQFIRVDTGGGAGFLSPPYAQGRTDLPVPAGAWPDMYVSTGGFVELDVGHKLQMCVYQTSGATRTVYPLVGTLMRAA